MKHARTDATAKKVSPLMLAVFFAVSFLWMEFLFRACILRPFFGIGLVLTLLFTLPLALVCFLMCTFGSERLNHVLCCVLLGLAALVYSSQIVYYGVFSTFYILYSVQNVGQVMQFWRDIFLSIFRNLPAILCMWVPFVVYLVMGKRIAPARRIPRAGKGVTAGAVVVLHALAVVITLLLTKGDVSPAHLYTKEFAADSSMQTFGVATTMRLDLKYLIFGTDIDVDGDASSLPEQVPTDKDPEPEPIVYGDNVIDSLDFEQLAQAETDKSLKSMHEYFASITPTKENEYTGKFKGKNLIFIVAEGFSPYAVSETLTPTLYKLSHEGIQCTNYYTPGWGVSTSDGEYTSLLGLIPATGVHSMEYSADRYMPFALGNQLKAQGYNTQAYHNHTYTYYGRDKSHPNLGYKYQGIGNGLTLDYSTYFPGTNTKTRWPNSDYLMAKATAANYMDSEQPFHTYYLTVSGHMLYTFMGNTMSKYHQDKVMDLPYESAEVKAYLACQIELDLMVKELLDNLEARGIAEDTVIVVTADHYPYGLQQKNQPDFYSELAGHDTSSTFEKYRNTLILWHKGLESIVIDEPTYSIDVLPTLCNLFGLDYDSRLLIGRDFLSDAPSLVCFSNRSWITDYGRYDSQSGTFTANEGVTVAEDYVKTVSAVVRRKFTYADLILKKDYYAKIFK